MFVCFVSHCSKLTDSKKGVMETSNLQMVGQMHK